MIDDSDLDKTDDKDPTFDSEFDEDGANSSESNDSKASSDLDITGRNNVSNLELMRDENGELILYSQT